MIASVFASVLVSLLLLLCAARSRVAILVAAILVSPFEGLGILPLAGSRVFAFSLAIILFVCRTFWDILIGRARLSVCRYGNGILWGMACLVLWYTAVTLITPRVFSGIPVYSPRAGIDGQVFIKEALQPGVTNFIQLAYLYTNVFFVIAILFVSPRISALVIYRSVLGSIGIALLLLVVNQLLIYAGQQAILNIFYPFAELRGEAFGQLMGSRPFVPFLEPSQAGMFLAGASALTFLTYLNKGGVMRLLLFVICLVCVFFVKSTVGAAGSAIGCAIGLTLLLLLRKGAVPLITIRFLVICGLGMVAILFTWDYVANYYYSVYLDKIGGRSFEHRSYSNEDAIEVMKDTMLLGAGLGSNRASSLVYTLISAVGPLGFVLYALLFLTPWVVALKFALFNADVIESGVFCAAIVIACMLAVPDLSYPFMWFGLAWFWVAIIESASRKKEPVRRPRPRMVHTVGGLQQGSV